MLHCPCCHRQHPTLRDLLTCCPVELRRLMDRLSADGRRGYDGVAWPDVMRYLSGQPLPPRYRDALTTDTPQEDA